MARWGLAGVVSLLLVVVACDDSDGGTPAFPGAGGAPEPGDGATRNDTGGTAPGSGGTPGSGGILGSGATAGGGGSGSSTGGSAGAADAGRAGASAGGTGGSATGGASSGGTGLNSGGAGGEVGGGPPSAGGSPGTGGSSGGAGGALDAGAGGASGCPPDQRDCAGVCGGPGAALDAGCCASGVVDCAGRCEGVAVSTATGCCRSGHVDCAGVCDGPGNTVAGACCGSGHADCAGACDGPGILRGTQCCATGVCPAETCKDGFKNGDESSVDCGGATCPGCGAGAECKTGSDCTYFLECRGGHCAVPATVTTSQSLLALDALGLARNPVDGTVYASVGSDTRFADSVVALPPYELAPSWSVVTGSTTAPVAVSDDGSTLYAGVQSSNASVVRVNLSTHRITSTFSTGSDASYGPLMPAELDVRPGDPDTVAVTGDFSGTTASPGIHVFTNGVDHSTGPDLTHWQTNTSAAIYDVTTTVFASPDTLYGYDGSSSGFELATIHFDSQGLKVLKEPGDLIHEYYVQMRMAGGRLFASTGEILDPTLPAVIGKVPGTRAAALAVSPSGARIYMVRFNLDAHRYEVHCYDAATSRPTGGFVLDPNLANFRTYGQLGSAEVWGTRGLVVQLVDVQKNALLLVPNALEVPGCSPEGDTPHLPPTITSPDGTFGGAAALDIAANTIARDPASGGIYIGVGAVDSRLPNHIAYVPPGNVRVDWSAPTGPDPVTLGPTADGNAVWVGLASVQTIQSIDTRTRLPTRTFTLPFSDREGPEFPLYLKAVPGQAGSVAVSGYYTSTSATPIIRIYDNGVDREAWKNRARIDELLSGLNLQDLEFRGNVMFAQDDNYFRTFDVSAQGLVKTGEYDFLSSQRRGHLTAIGSRLFASGGRVVDIPELYPLGRVYYGNEIVSADGARSYFLDDSYLLHCYDLSTFVESGSIKLEAAGFSSPGQMVLWGEAGLAVNSREAGVLFFADILNATRGCEPRSTGAAPPGANVAPDRVSADGAILEYSLTARALVTNPASGAVYVSTQVTDARFPNQLVAIEPAATTTSWAVRTGSSPDAIGVSDDGTTAYVGLDGAGRIARVDTVAHTVVDTFPIGLVDGGLLLLLDVDVAPNDNDTFVATAQGEKLAYANGSIGPILFRNDRLLFPATLTEDSFGTWQGTTRVEFAGANTVFSHGVELVKMSLTGNTLARISSSSTLVPSVFDSSSEAMTFAAGRLFYGGYEVDPAGPTLIGSVPNLGGSSIQVGMPVMTDDGQRIVAVTNSGADSSGTMSLRCFDAKTFAQIGGPYTFTPPTNTNSPFATGLTPWGPAGVVVRTFANTLLFMPHVLRDIGCR